MQTGLFYFVTWSWVHSLALAGKHLRVFSLVFPCKVCPYISCCSLALTLVFPYKYWAQALIVRLPLQMPPLWASAHKVAAGCISIHGWLLWSATPPSPYRSFQLVLCPCYGSVHIFSTCVIQWLKKLSQCLHHFQYPLYSTSKCENMNKVWQYTWKLCFMAIIW